MSKIIFLSGGKVLAVNLLDQGQDLGVLVGGRVLVAAPPSLPVLVDEADPGEPLLLRHDQVGDHTRRHARLVPRHKNIHLVFSEGRSLFFLN